MTVHFRDSHIYCRINSFNYLTIFGGIGLRRYLLAHLLSFGATQQITKMKLQVFTIRNEGLRPKERVPLSGSMIRSSRNFRKKFRMLVVSRIIA
jgi:hypothetical protein